jgi:hypothetical protein
VGKIEVQSRRLPDRVDHIAGRRNKKVADLVKWVIVHDTGTYYCADKSRVV